MAGIRGASAPWARSALRMRSYISAATRDRRWRACAGSLSATWPYRSRPCHVACEEADTTLEEVAVTATRHLLGCDGQGGSIQTLKHREMQTPLDSPRSCKSASLLRLR